MRMKIFPWLGQECVALSGEADPGLSPEKGTEVLLQSFSQRLESVGFSLADTVRTRLWARDRESRNAGSEVRVRVLTGPARSSSSSYIAPEHLDSQSRIALDLLAMKPTRPGATKVLKEYDPPITPLRYLRLDSVVVLSGVTAVLPTLAEQVNDILPRIEGSLVDAGSSWEEVVKVSCFLHRSQKLRDLKRAWESVRKEVPALECSFVDGYSAEGKLVEIEVTATKP